MEIPVGIYEEITGMPELPPPADEAEHERRKSQRVPFGFRAVTTQERRGGGESEPAVVMVRDISTSGVSFINAEALRPATPFIIEFKGYQDRPVKIRCAVTRCAIGGVEGTQYIVGASFEELLTKEMPPVKPAEIPKLVPMTEPKPVEVKPIEQKAAESKVEIMENKDGQAASQQQVEITEAPKPAANPEAPAPVIKPPQPAAPAKPAGLFRPTEPGTAKPQPSESDQYSIEGEPLQKKAPAPKPVAVPENNDAPVFRVVPLPDVEPENEKEHTPTMELGHATSTATGKNHEVLVRVKGMLLKQEQTIKAQQKKIESMRADIAKMSRQLDELRNKTTVDDQSIAELAEFLQQHEGDENPARKSEAA